MAAAAAAAAARSFLRSGVASSSSIRGAAARAASRAGPAPLPRRLPAAAPRLILRSPVEMSSVCLETLMPMHSATASALMTSLLAAPACRSFGWLSEVGIPLTALIHVYCRLVLVSNSFREYFSLFPGHFGHLFVR
ncbi:hypothetical protein OsI_03773 [Oryza sativa Indica Group]|uniref:Uncharacterized protein n=1 Tax=Oryza sativa subsp. indica TaxID=39946 RepID=A2WV60_ORYSI|nr:hypothetical protein OsI_03773 [Oryza sativa Indica Group]